MKITVTRNDGTTYELTEATHEWLVLAHPTNGARVDVFMCGSYTSVAAMIDVCIRSSPELIVELFALVATGHQDKRQEAN